MQLPNPLKTYNEKHAVISGYGWDWINVTEDFENGGSYRGKLRFAVTKVLSNNDCQSRYSAGRKIAPSNLCAQVLQRATIGPEGVCAVSIDEYIFKLYSNMNISI